MAVVQWFTSKTSIVALTKFCQARNHKNLPRLSSDEFWGIPKNKKNKGCQFVSSQVLVCWTYLLIDIRNSQNGAELQEWLGRCRHEGPPRFLLAKILVRTGRVFSQAIPGDIEGGRPGQCSSLQTLPHLCTSDPYGLSSEIQRGKITHNLSDYIFHKRDFEAPTFSLLVFQDGPQRGEWMKQFGEE